MKNICIMGLVVFLLGGCSLPTRYERDPSSAGFGRDAVKKSRCACDMFYQNGHYL